MIWNLHIQKHHAVALRRVVIHNVHAVALKINVYQITYTVEYKLVLHIEI